MLRLVSLEKKTIVVQYEGRGCYNVDVMISLIIVDCYNLIYHYVQEQIQKY